MKVAPAPAKATAVSDFGHVDAETARLLVDSPAT